MGLLNQMGYVNNGNGWELTPAGKTKMATAAKSKIEGYISSAQSALQEEAIDTMNFNKDWAQRLTDSAFANDLIDIAQKSIYQSMIDAISAP